MIYLQIVKVLGEFKDSKVLNNLVETALKSFGKIDILVIPVFAL